MSGDSSIPEVKADIRNDRLIKEILERGIQRREINADRLTSRIISLPTDLMRHDLLVTLTPLTEDATRKIVEEVFLPLIRRHD